MKGRLASNRGPLILDDLARLVDAEYAGLVRYIAERYLRRPFGWRALAIAVNSLNTAKLIVRQ